MSRYLRILRTLAVGAPLLGASGAGAERFAVDSTQDTPDLVIDGVCADAGGNCSLRAALQEANAAAPEAFRIKVPAGLFTLALGGSGEDAAASGDLDVVSEAVMRIRGTGESTVIDADGLDRVFDVQAGGALELRKLVIQNGNTPATEQGGGIRNAGTLLMQDVALIANTADALLSGAGGGLHNSGDLMVRKSTFSANTASSQGGGLYHTGEGMAAIDGSTFTGNQANGALASDGGGGLYNDGGTLTVTRSEFVENTAQGELADSASGGGILNNAGTLTVEKSTFTGNQAQRAGGGIESDAGTTTLDKVDMSSNDAGTNPGNGGGFHQTGNGTVTVSKGRYETNTAAAEGGALWNGTGTMSVVGARITGNTAGGDGADQGGGGLFNAGGILMVEKSRIEQNVADGTSGSGGGILTDGGTLVVVKSRIDGNTAVRAGGGIESNAGDVDLEKVQLRGNATGNSPGNGGALHLTGEAEVNVLSSKVLRNTARSEGGGLWNSATGTMTVSRSQVRDNVASGVAADDGGGGLFNDGGTLVVDQKSKISRNAADGAAGSGGGILNDGGDLSVSDSTIDRNTSVLAGGGIEAVGATLETGTTTLTNVKLQGNATGGIPGNGGGLHLTANGLVEIAGSKVTKNSAATEGGGLWNSATGTMTVTGTMIQGNEAPTGPDTFNDGGDFTIDGEAVPDDSP